ncbi:MULTISPECIES: transporter substrate-binding domain-containing protein [unclassified Mesorhizobium]|uniref:transporter substrate-binding domain-containing protein n=1 Tax=unclassified Mesorhizobium TaxID=325217 RepID=UPI000FE99551|nr:MULTISPECIES: transporter substrate-binding domain-containing protein [unclassified Mesorhizobium]RWI22943.1 MAG: transporter substrate-binding domain-containing protein [Mesorhizobium sp.]RWK48524.1 MAG: transporter substrate-binding domain-containing protein [Mesorhizobium sp.]RWK94328.1 MAG: transporter substrate-binding domain-containing protein [Mesorhizobium sp.]TIP61326.1 MAG: transporter substrate-binding domain-containing protein [Mesorhizobium sp.]TIQ29509.1 MAG: transporter subst
MLAFAAAVGMAMASSPQARADALSDIAARGTVRIAVPQDFPPFGSVGADMTPQGYDVDIANLIGEKLGAKVEIVPVTSANRIPYLQTNKVDLVISSLGKNPDREKVIDFSEAYAPFYNGVFAPADVAVAKAADLAGKTVGVTRGAIEDLELTKVVPASVEIKRYEDNNGTISAFLSGQVEVIATGNVVAAAILEKNPPKRPELKFLIKNSPCYIGMNKEQPALMAKINGIIAAARSDGALNAISQKWLKVDLPADL